MPNFCQVAMVGAGRYANTWARAYYNNPRCTIVAVRLVHWHSVIGHAHRFCTPQR